MRALNDPIKAVFSSRLMQSCALVALLCAGPFVGIRDEGEILDYDLWWHLKVGDWILANHSLPHTGLFSQFGASKVWVAYSWGFEVVLAYFYSLFGLLGIYVLRFCVEVIITLAIFQLLQRISERFWTSLLLTGLGLWAIYHNLAIRPVLSSIFFWIISFALILESQRRKSVRPLYFLIPLFLVWANFHIQFVYGLFLVALFILVEIARAIVSRFGWDFVEHEGIPKLPLVPVVGIGILCVLATMVGPYGIGPYKVILEIAQSKSTYSQITELAALSFRSSAHYVQLLLTIGAFFALGRKSKDPFRILLLLATALVAFRTTRDSWFVCIPSLVMIAEAFAAPAAKHKARIRTIWLQGAGVTIGVAVVIFALMRDAGLNERKLTAAVEDFFPARSAEFIRANRLPGPLYNNLNIGGFLIWALPEYPVAIDGRSNLYGDQYGDRYYAVLNGTSNPMLDPDLQKARVVVLQRGFPLTNYMYQDPRFRLVFEDSNAVVFVRGQ